MTNSSCNESAEPPGYYSVPLDTFHVTLDLLGFFLNYWVIHTGLFSNSITGNYKIPLTYLALIDLLHCVVSLMCTVFTGVQSFSQFLRSTTAGCTGLLIAQHISVGLLMTAPSITPLQRFLVSQYLI